MRVIWDILIRNLTPIIPFQLAIIMRFLPLSFSRSEFYLRNINGGGLSLEILKSYIIVIENISDCQSWNKHQPAEHKQ